jgi:hypothetical protein
VAGIEAAYAEQFAAGGDYSLEVMREDMVVADGWIVSWGGYVATVAAEGAEPFEVTGRYGSVNRQEADGTWKIYAHLQLHRAAARIRAGDVGQHARRILHAHRAGRTEFGWLLGAARLPATGASPSYAPFR